MGKARQIPLPLPRANLSANHVSAGMTENRGAVYTKLEVIEFILDLINFTDNQPLYEFKLLEPSFGDGDFLMEVVRRLMKSYKRKSSKCSDIVNDLCDSIRAVEINRDSINVAFSKLFDFLTNQGVDKEKAIRLLQSWIVEGDFLLTDLKHSFTHVVGNPPYVRQELIPEDLMAEYKSRYTTIYERSDLYIPFIEKCLQSLGPKGILGFICSDRWMKNKYGGPLREMVAEGFHLLYYIDMVNTPAFHAEVTAYPAITVISREKAGPTRVAKRPRVDRKELSELARQMKSDDIHHTNNGIWEINDITVNRNPWIFKSPPQLALIRRLENELPGLEEAGCKVGIGVATGADNIFIGPFEELNVEFDRKLPLVMTKDIRKGEIEWSGAGVINPFDENGKLVNLAKYPRLAQYLYNHREKLIQRNCAKRNPRSWYRTIDRIYANLRTRTKLLIPDIKGQAHIVYENGQYYPHHNLYFITSDEWDLEALQTVLLSGVAKFFVSNYSTQMRGGYLRFQAQYLRRIRIPRWNNIPPATRKMLTNKKDRNNKKVVKTLISELFTLTPEEYSIIDNCEKT